MTRVLRRPMFRIGGSAGEGITSGLAPRQGYKNAKRVTFDEEKGYNLQDLIDAGIYRTGGKEPTVSGNTDTTGTNTQSIMDAVTQRANILDAMYPRQKTDSMAGANFLMNWGIDLASRPRSGNIFQQAATSAKNPLLQFQQEKLMEKAAARKETSEDRALLAKMLEGMDDDKLSALMKDVKAGVEAGEFPDEKTGIKLLLQKKIYGVLPMEGEVYEDNIKDIEKQLQRENIPTLMLRSVAEHIYKANNNLYPPKIQADLDKVRGYVKPMHIVGDSRDEDGEIIEFVVDSKFDRTYRPNKIYFDPETGNLFKRVGKRGEAIIFKKVIFEE